MHKKMEKNVTEARTWDQVVLQKAFNEMVKVRVLCLDVQIVGQTT